MRNRFAFFAVIVVLLAQIAPAVDYKEIRAAREKKVLVDMTRQLFEGYVIDNTGTADKSDTVETLESICDENITSILTGGKILNNRQQLIDLLTQQQGQIRESFTKFDVKFTEQSIEVFSDTASVLGTFRLWGTLKDNSTKTNNILVNLNFKKSSGKWSIFRFQATALNNEAAPAQNQPDNSLRQAPPAAITVDGKPFFVICARDAVVDEFAEYKRAGFNTVFTHKTHTPGLEEAKRYGLKAIDVFPDYLFDHNKKRFQPSYWEKIKKQIAERKDNPALLAWSMPTDSIGFGVNPFEIKEIVNLTANGGNRKYRLINFAGSVDSLNPYLEYVDIVFYEHWGLKKQVPAISRKMDKLRNTNKVAWYMQHAVKGDRLPGIEQFRSHIFLAVNHGATGILIDGFEPLLWKEFVGDKEYVSLGDPELADMRAEAMQVAHELATLAPAILAGALADDMCDQDNPDLDTKAYIKPGSDALYIVAVNKKNKALQQSFTVAETKRSSAMVMREGRKVQIISNSFIDNFEPLQTHIYKLTVDPEPYSKAYEGPAGTQNAANTIVGIGIKFGCTEKGALIHYLAGAPAKQAGLEAGFIITAVDGISIAGKTEGEIVDLIKGPAGTTVTLDALTHNGPKTFKITREKITLK